MALLLVNSLASAEEEFARLLQLSLENRLQPHDISPSLTPRIAAAAIQPTPSVVACGSVDSGATAHTSPLTSPSAPGPKPASPPAAAAEGTPLLESERGELRRLVATVHDLSETSDRIMAQNIALLADLEVAQRAVRELRSEKDALAVQLRRLLSAQG